MSVIRMTPERYAEILARNSGGSRKLTGKAAMQALGRLPVGTMNKTERQYSEYLGDLVYSGEVLWWRFEGLKLRLADNTFYTPDFAVLAKDFVMECREVKGHWHDDARVKIKVAAAMYPFRFMAVQAVAAKNGGGWKTEEF